MPTVSEALKSTFDSARSRLAGLEKGVEKLEKRAKSSLGEIRARVDRAPKRIEGAWSDLVARVRPPFATREEFRQLSEKVDDLAARIDKLAPGGRRKTTAS